MAKMIAVANAGIAVGGVYGSLSFSPAAILPPGLGRSFSDLRGELSVTQGFMGEAAATLDQRAWLRKKWNRNSLGDISRVDFLLGKVGLYLGFDDANRLAALKRDFIPMAQAAGWPVKNWHPRDQAYYDARGWTGGLTGFSGTTNFESLYQKEMEARTKLHFAVIVGALHAVRARSGHWPPALKSLVPHELAADLLTDPFTGKDFGYAVRDKAKGYELFSAGAWGTRLDSKGGNLEVVEPLPPAQTKKEKK